VHHYGTERAQIQIIENGVDAIGVPFIAQEYVAEIRRWLGVKDGLIAVFGGSFYQANFHAADEIIALARRSPQVTFLILGGICDYQPLKVANQRNLIRLGQVDEDTKWTAFSIADIGLNPMQEGSGSAVKMFEYAAAGLTILTTPWGARGVPLSAEREILVREPTVWADLLHQYAALDPEERKRIGCRAREVVLASADWTIIGGRYRALFQALWDPGAALRPVMHHKAAEARAGIVN
jgi:glycosyltransferase involved in cell wall biosynthesis